MVSKNEKLHFPQVWGGIECTINRIHDNFLDQLDLAGFYNHREWIHDIIRLGIKTLRFPVLWERHQPVQNEDINWKFTEDQLITLRDNKITAIVGLLHHGSGPGFTNLLDPDFPELFASYASQVANKFPWVKYYTPINEPLTTARFSGLYGHWFPHKKNDVSFVKMLLNQLKATVLALREIRKINPEAQFVQTEDLGKTYSTALLSYQAAFENSRCWLTYDILCGKLDQQHPLWNYFLRLGIDEQQLHFFIDNPCAPDIIGVNHYLTSERFLDDNIENYPDHFVGGNNVHHYVDVEAVRVRMAEPHGIKILLQEIWQRYKIPLAVTEVHLHCTREEQLRWLKEVHDTAAVLNHEGVDIIAVTAWALLGSFGWNKLLTCPAAECEYETGAFDISTGVPRQTALSSLIKDLNQRTPVTNALLDQQGWWKLDTRFLEKTRQNDHGHIQKSIQPIVIIGSTGTLGKAFSRICTQRNLQHYLLGRNDADICDSSKLETMINHYHPWAIINTAGFVRVDEAEENEEQCYRENYLGPQKLAILCEKYKIKLVTFSSDLVFDGEKEFSYDEDDKPNALNVYGLSKQLAEEFCRKVNPGALIIRTSAFFGGWDTHNFVYDILYQLGAGNSVAVPDDIQISPTYVPHLVNASLDLLVDNEAGIWHLANKGTCTWYQFAKMIAIKAGYDPGIIRPGYNVKTSALRPRNSVLTSKRYNLMPALETALEQFFLHSNGVMPAGILTK